ncbi:IclR family transcriptional regulator [Streptomyces sp. NPDC087844]|uniref:IclR family transcriptional regulator n=1 Tax=Streptomyces sp. NPDC087844 TaxID=3365805 RepID=UPI00381CE34E
MPGSVSRDAGIGQGRRGRNATADRALDILLMFDDDRLVLSAADVATRLGVARSTALRYLQSLTGNGFLEEDDGSGFRLGPRVVDLARLARKGVGLSDLARPVMRGLVKRTGMPALLTRRTGGTVVCLERVDAGTSLRLSCERGEVLAINA